MSGLEIHRLLRSMKLEGLRLGRVWRTGDAFVFEAGRKFLIVRPGAIYLSSYAPRGSADSFSMFLRKRVQGKVVRSVRQHGLDRVVFLDLGDCQLVFELFARGNVIYLENGKVAGFLHPSKRFVRGGEYTPPGSVDYLSLPVEDFRKLVAGKTKAELARLLGIGKLVEELPLEPRDMLSRLRAMAEEPLDPRDVERRFKAIDTESLRKKEEEKRSAKKKRLEKSIEELKHRIYDYEGDARRLVAAAERIMEDLPRYQSLLEKAFRKGKKKIKVSLPDT